MIPAHNYGRIHVAQIPGRRYISSFLRGYLVPGKKLYSLKKGEIIAMAAGFILMAAFILYLWQRDAKPEPPPAVATDGAAR